MQPLSKQRHDVTHHLGYVKRLFKKYVNNINIQVIRPVLFGDDVQLHKYCVAIDWYILCKYILWDQN